MNTYLISYDLGQPETRQDYVNLIAKIKSYSWWAKPLYSVWFVKSKKTAGEIRDELKGFLDANDKLLVIQIVKHWGTYGVSKEVNEWMKNNIE
ncbi:MAG: hypothetical protein WCS89_01280 [Candidatus Paceibacterota bacterium]|jgi:hypothetical protein